LQKNFASRMATMSDPTVIFTPSGKRGKFPDGTPVLSAARALGVDLDSVCGGRGICGRCQVTPAYGTFPKHSMIATADALSPMNDVERRYADKRGLAHGRRLGCQAVITGDMVIDVPPESQVHRQIVRKAATARAMRMDPATRAFVIDVAPPDMHDPSGDFERLAEALSAQWDVAGLTCDPVMLPRVQSALRRGNWQVAVAVHDDGQSVPLLTGIWADLPRTGLCGIAIDLGSTTIAAHLCDLATGDVLASAGVMNPQIRFGEDLMSRVSHAMLDPDGTAQMATAVRGALDGLVHDLAAQVAIPTDTILELALVGNPVMHHLLLGIDPTELGQAPFALAHQGALRLAARDIGLTAPAPAARAYFLPCIAGHVGADAAAVALSEAPDTSEDLVLVVDVGTNAEILLGNRDRVLACSSPTGPAFEGAQISAGQRAAAGAIERVRIDPMTGAPRFRVIGCDLWSDDPGFAAAVTGICGSGIIEAVAELRMAGLLDSSGLLGGPEATGCDRMIAEGRTFAYLLHDGSATGGPRITVTQGDVRAIQLAKSALYAGARLLMDEFGTDVVDRVVLAGAFGAHISPLHAMVLGMIPDCPLDRVTSAGNAAGTGARMALASRAARAEVETLVRRITKVETAIAPRFQEHFVAANALPHATAPFPHLRGAVALPEPRFGAAASTRRRGRARQAAQDDG
jgi:uncharacterized 2Fe-2S/4Fe-4S cluster protein (DUF4445 family)